MTWKVPIFCKSILRQYSYGISRCPAGFLQEREGGIQEFRFRSLSAGRSDDIPNCICSTAKFQKFLQSQGSVDTKPWWQGWHADRLLPDVFIERWSWDRLLWYIFWLSWISQNAKKNSRYQTKLELFPSDGWCSPLPILSTFLIPLCVGILDPFPGPMRVTLKWIRKNLQIISL